jgi:glutathione peroxidase
MSMQPHLRRGSIAAMIAVAVGAGCANEPRPAPGAASAAAENRAEGTKAMSFHDFTMKTIDGEQRSLDEHKGKVLLVVNVASACGYTPQYEGMEKLHERLKDRGFAVLGFPSNDFGAQEPGTEEQIKSFCTTNFGVTFPMYAKIPVKGASKHPLYAFLTQGPPAGEVSWNFEKFLVGKDGQVIGRYKSSVTPEDPKLAEDIERALGQ